VDRVLLKCLGEEKSRIAMGEFHKGLCRSHQPTHKMKWVLRRAGYFWPTMVEDCEREGVRHAKNLEIYKPHQPASCTPS
jgi:hypothetical protein